MRSKSAVAAFNLLVALGGCRTTSSRTLHDVDHPVADKDSWVELSRDEYLRVALVNSEGKTFDSSLLLPDDHMLTKRAQYWIDLIDRTLRQKYPDQLSGVPHPRAGVIASKVDNAYALPAASCSLVLLRMSPTSTATVATIGVLGQVKSDDGTTAYLGEVKDQDCAQRPLTASFIDNLTSDEGSSDCIVHKAEGSSASSPILVLGRPCSKLSPALAGADAGAAKGAAIQLMSNWITLYSHIFSIAQDERELTAILAHELGHYFRAHGVSQSVKYDFFYKVADDSLGKRPAEDPSVAALGAQVLDVSKRIETSDFAAVDDAGFGYGLSAYFTLLGLEVQANNLCKSDAACRSDCDSFVKMQSPAFSATTSAQVFDAAFISCVNHLPVSAAPGKSVFDDYPLSVYAVTLKKIPDIEALVQGLIAKNPTWGAVLQGLNDAMLAKVKPDQAVLAQAAAQDLGYYTIEQEADELSAEWLAMIGIDPGFATKTYLDLLVAEGGSGVRGVTNVAFSSPGQAGCQALYKRGWKDGAGAPVFIPLGDYNEPHHNTCYRAWNIDREIRGHKYQIAAPPVFPAPAWSEVVAAALAASK